MKRHLGCTFPILLAASSCCAASYVIDPEAFKYSQMKVSLVSPEASYWNVMTADRVKETPHVTIESRERGYISEVFATLPIDAMDKCNLGKPESIFLVIVFSEESSSIEFFSDGSALYSNDYQRCAPVSKDFLDRFDLRARMTK